MPLILLIAGLLLFLLVANSVVHVIGLVLLIVGAVMLLYGLVAVAALGRGVGRWLKP